MKKYTALNLKRLGERLKDCHTLSELKAAINPLTKRKCPHYGVVKDTDGYHLIFVGISDYMNFELLLEIAKTLEGYIYKTISIDECCLTDRQILLLTLYGYGMIVAIDTIDSTIEVYALQKEFDSNYANIQKKKLFERVDSKYQSATERRQ